MACSFFTFGLQRARSSARDTIGRKVEAAHLFGACRRNRREKKCGWYRIVGMPANPDLSARLKQKVDSEMQPGETVLWMARPKAPADAPGFLARLMQPEDLFVITNRRA